MLDTGTELEEQRSESCAPELWMQQGQEAQPREWRATEELCQKEDNSKAEAEMRAGGIQGSKSWIELCRPIAKWEADPTAKAEGRKGDQNELGGQILSQAPGSPFICFPKSSKNCKASPRCPAWRVWCQIHHAGVTLITEQQLRSFTAPTTSPGALTETLKSA